MSPISRRDFLKTSAAGLASVLVAPVRPAGLLPRAAVFSANPAETRANVLVTVFLRGGVDGLNAIIPLGDAEYARLRPTIRIREPKVGDAETAIQLDGFYGMHPSMRLLKEIWDDKGLAAIHAVGSPDPTHSHFDAMDYMERGTPGIKTLSSGWLGRHLESSSTKSASPFRAVGFGSMLQLSLRGKNPALLLQTLDGFKLDAGANQAALLDVFKGSLASSYKLGSAIDDEAALTFSAISTLQKVTAETYKPTGGAIYPETEFGLAMKQVAQLIKAGIGLELANVDLDGWDHHILEGSTGGIMHHMLEEVSGALNAFYKDLGDGMRFVTVVVMSEFGRRARENGGRGTDHGHGGVMFVMGKKVNGGRVYGTFPGLAADKLYGPGDLEITTDFRSVLGEVAQKHLLNPALDKIFPGFTAYKSLGLLQDI